MGAFCLCRVRRMHRMHLLGIGSVIKLRIANLSIYLLKSFNSYERKLSKSHIGYTILKRLLIV